MPIPIKSSPQQQLAAAKLTKQQTRCLAMWCFDGFTFEEIADRLDISKASVQKHVERARAKLDALGLDVPRLDMAERPKVMTVDPRWIDQLGPDDMKAQW